MSYELPTTGQGNMKPLSPEDQERDDIGFTNPNLHRRIEHNVNEGEVGPRNYNLAIQTIYSYRTTEYATHDEDGVSSDIP